VGSLAVELRFDDRVANLHKLKTPHVSYAEYALGEKHCTFMLPENVSYEEGVTIPLAGMTAAIGLFNSLARTLVPARGIH
jgi:NADPH2:quinone reductase